MTPWLGPVEGRSSTSSQGGATSLKRFARNPIDTLGARTRFEERNRSVPLPASWRLRDGPPSSLSPTNEPAILTKSFAGLKGVWRPFEAGNVTRQSRAETALPSGADPWSTSPASQNPLSLSSFVRRCRGSGAVSIVFTAAEQYYPLDSDLKRVLEAEATAKPPRTPTLSQGCAYGRTSPYKLVPFTSVESDGTRIAKSLRLCLI